MRNHMQQCKPTRWAFLLLELSQAVCHALGRSSARVPSWLQSHSGHPLPASLEGFKDQEVVADWQVSSRDWKGGWERGERGHDSWWEPALLNPFIQIIKDHRVSANSRP